MPLTTAGQAYLASLDRPECCGSQHDGRATTPIIEVRQTSAGYAVFKCGSPVRQFSGKSARAEAWEYAETLLDDLRYEAERGA